MTTTEAPAPPVGKRVFCLTSAGRVKPANRYLPADAVSWTWEGGPAWYPVERRPGQNERFSREAMR